MRHHHARRIASRRRCPRVPFQGGVAIRAASSPRLAPHCETTFLVSYNYGGETDPTGYAIRGCLRHPGIALFADASISSSRPVTGTAPILPDNTRSQQELCRLLAGERRQPRRASTGRPIHYPAAIGGRAVAVRREIRRPALQTRRQGIKHQLDAVRVLGTVPIVGSISRVPLGRVLPIVDELDGAAAVRCQSVSSPGETQSARVPMNRGPPAPHQATRTSPWPAHKPSILTPPPWGNRPVASSATSSRYWTATVSAATQGTQAGRRAESLWRSDARLRSGLREHIAPTWSSVPTYTTMPGDNAAGLRLAQEPAGRGAEKRFVQQSGRCWARGCEFVAPGSTPTHSITMASIRIGSCGDRSRQYARGECELLSRKGLHRIKYDTCEAGAKPVLAVAPLAGPCVQSTVPAADYVAVGGWCHEAVRKAWAPPRLTGAGFAADGGEVDLQP